jgi:molecular chaperone DnaK (HSP70)
MGGGDLSTQVNCNEAVALGCAIQASVLVNAGDGAETWEKVKGEEGDDISRDIQQTKSAVSILLANKTSDIIFPVGTAVPALQKRIVAVNGGNVALHFSEPKGAKVGFSSKESSMELSFMIDESGCLKVSNGEKEVVITK